MKLTNLPLHQEARILAIPSAIGLKKKLLSLGIDTQQTIRLKYKAPFNGPICIEGNGQQIIIRKKDAEGILVQVDQ